MDSNVKSFKYVQLRKVLSRLSSLDGCYSCEELHKELETLEDSQKVITNFIYCYKFFYAELLKYLLKAIKAYILHQIGMVLI